MTSKRCSVSQFVADRKGSFCSLFLFDAARCDLVSRTFKPKVAGSNPARPTRSFLLNGSPLRVYRSAWSMSSFSTGSWRACPAARNGHPLRRARLPLCRR